MPNSCNIVDMDVPGPFTLERAYSDYRVLLKTIVASHYVVGVAQGFDAGINYAYLELLEGTETVTTQACEPEDVSLEVAKQRLKSYFEDHHGQAFDYGDLREALCIALPIIVEACDQLEREGKIAGVD